MRIRGTVLFVLLLLVVAPVAAGWAGKGAYEPSTTRDVDDGFMFTTPDQSPAGSKVYFNGFYTQCTVNVCGGAQGVYWDALSPNSGAAQSGILTTFIIHHALLGVWKDCNQDGYVGFGDQGLHEYRAELLMGDTSVCSVQDVPRDRFGAYAPPMGWKPVHNDGTWIHEFLPLMWHQWNKPDDPNPWDIPDNSSRVWVDGGLPDSQTPPRRCWIYPQPYGTYRSTGGLVEFADCHLDWAITGTLSELSTITGMGELTFDDKPRDQSESASPLNQRNPWGAQGDASYAKVWDCSAEPAFVTRDPTDPGDGSGSLHGVTVANPYNNAPIHLNLTDEAGYFAPLGATGRITFNVSSPGVGAPDADGSAAGTVNETESGFKECDRNKPHKVGVGVGPGYSNGDAPYLLESSSQVNFVDKRVQSDITLVPDAQSRSTNHRLGPGTPLDYGVRQTNHEGMWIANNVVQATNAFVDVDDAELQQPVHFTYYAFVSPEAASKYGLTLPGVTAQYGAEACALAQPTFECDPSKWWKAHDGRDIVPRSCFLGVEEEDRLKTEGRRCIRIGAIVKDPYNLRDIDCYDTSVGPARENGVHWGAATASGCA